MKLLSEQCHGASETHLACSLDGGCHSDRNASKISMSETLVWLLQSTRNANVVLQKSRVERKKALIAAVRLKRATFASHHDPKSPPR